MCISKQTLPVLLVLATVAVASAEQPLLSPKQLQDRSTHILVGEVKAIYSYTARKGDFERTYYVTELTIRKVEKGKRLREGNLLYARTWGQKWVGKADPVPPHATGHYATELEVGHKSRLFLTRNKQDKGFDVLLPNGAEKVADDGGADQ